MTTALLPEYFIGFLVKFKRLGVVTQFTTNSSHLCKRNTGEKQRKHTTIM